MNITTLRRLRQFHRDIGLFFAPAILFFAFSGTIQTIGIQDGVYGPSPGWISWIAAIHKHQLPPRPKQADHDAGHGHDAGENHDDGHDADHDHDHGHQKPGDAPFVPLKLFVILLGVALMASTMLGITLGLANRAGRVAPLLWLGAGVVVPLVMMAF